jgi:hypothetical protein
VKGEWLFVFTQVHHIFIVNEPEVDVAQPALTTNYVSRRVWGFGEVDSALKSEASGFESDFASKGNNGAAQSIQSLGNAGFYIQPQG